MLFSHLRIHQIYGANTDVGKTIFSTILSLASLAQKRKTFYLKPISTGSIEKADDVHVRNYMPPGSDIDVSCLMQMDKPVSPHLAALDAQKTFSDGELIGGVTNYVYRCSKQWKGAKELATMLFETAGGVLSPAPSGALQADAYRPLRLPVILVADSLLGGISSTLSAYESLKSRGYDVDTVLMFTNDYFQNHEYLEPWLRERGVKLLAVESPPPRRKRLAAEKYRMKGYYARISSSPEIHSLMRDLDDIHKKRLRRLDAMPKKAMDTFWYPFVQHKLIASVEDIVTVDSAYKDTFTVTASSPIDNSNNQELLAPMVDGSASWWTQGVGHAHPRLTAAASYAAGRYGHVIFPQIVHEPALDLAERLLRSQGAGWATRVFFSDNGSTGMEVALKMALRATAVLYSPTRPKPDLDILGLSGSYHGDTLGAMEASEGGVYNSTVEWYRGRGLWLTPPTLGYKDGELFVHIPWENKERNLASLTEAYDIGSRRGGELEEMYRHHIENTITEAVRAGRKFGALVLEPLVLGAGGMKFVDPLFQTIFVEVVRAMGQQLLPAVQPDQPPATVKTLPVIFDEVFTGLGRLGLSSSVSILGVKPDIAVYAKLLTGGLVPMAATLASDEIFSAFMGDSKAAALLHGHSYTAYPVGCAVATSALDILDDALKGPTFQDARRQWRNRKRREVDLALEEPLPTEMGSLWSPTFVEALSRKDEINSVMTLGTVLAFELKTDNSGYGSSAAERALAPLKRHGDTPTEGIPIHFRTLGNVGYLITSLTTEKHHLRRMEAQLLQCFKS